LSIPSIAQHLQLNRTITQSCKIEHTSPQSAKMTSYSTSFYCTIYHSVIELQGHHTNQQHVQLQGHYHSVGPVTGATSSVFSAGRCAAGRRRGSSAYSKAEEDVVGAGQSSGGRGRAERSPGGARADHGGAGQSSGGAGRVGAGRGGGRRRRSGDAGGRELFPFPRASSFPARSAARPRGERRGEARTGLTRSLWIQFA
jgi:hypothetical protein